MGHIDRALDRAAQRAKKARQELPVAAELMEPTTERFELDDVRRAEVDLAELKRNRLVADDKAPSDAAYRMLRTRLLQRMRTNGWNTLAVTGMSPGEGKTTTSINLSLALARDVNTNVVLVDLDLRKPSIHSYFGLEPKYDFHDVLAGRAPLAEALIRPDLDGADRLALLLNSNPYTNASEMVTSPEMRRLVSNLKAGKGRIVVFDTPPLLITDDVLAFSPSVNGLLLVACQGVTKRDDLLAAKELMQGLNLVGTVLNRSSEEVNQYYYGYGYGA
jgi:Mrp family chromosome partitioning ATPase